MVWVTVEMVMVRLEMGAGGGMMGVHHSVVHLRRRKPVSDDRGFKL